MNTFFRVALGPKIKEYMRKRRRTVFNEKRECYIEQSMSNQDEIIPVLKISSLLGFGHAWATLEQTSFSQVWCMVVT